MTIFSSYVQGAWLHGYAYIQQNKQADVRPPVAPYGVSGKASTLICNWWYQVDISAMTNCYIHLSATSR